MKETAFVAQILEYLPLRGAIGIRVNSGMHFLEDAHGKKRAFRGAAAGTSDIICCYRGLFLAIECKVGDNKATALQLAFLDQVERAGGVGVVVWSLDELICEMDRIDERMG